jgi:hypothetical protein
MRLALLSSTALLVLPLANSTQAATKAGVGSVSPAEVARQLNYEQLYKEDKLADRGEFRLKRRISCAEQLKWAES